MTAVLFSTLLSALKLGAMLLADHGFDADWIRTFVSEHGGLRAFKGSQRYPIPAGVDLKNYPSAVIWCETFGVLIAPADLTASAK